MKIKIDFITNSSSSSFVVIGTRISPSDIPEEKLKEFEILVDAATMENDPGEYIYDLLKGTGLEYAYGYEYDGTMMVGIPYTSMKDDETLGEFKNRTKGTIKERLGIETDVDHIEECWHDG